MPLGEVIRHVLDPRNFAVKPGMRVQLAYNPAQEQSWEIFRGQLLDQGRTRQKQTFETWEVLIQEKDSQTLLPFVVINHDGAGRLFVIRSLQCQTWEAYSPAENVIESREITKWIRELVGTCSTATLANQDLLMDELIALVFHAVVGKSRLPLTSLEAPLPAFSLGFAAYFHRGTRSGYDSAPVSGWKDILEFSLHEGLSWLEKAKLLEFMLHLVPEAELPIAVAHLNKRWKEISSKPLLSAFRTVFNEVALSPYTDLVDKTLTLLEELGNQAVVTTGEQADFLGYLLRQQSRHLKAFDLITFHQRGANYPDALLIDAVLNSYLSLAEKDSEVLLDDRSDSEEIEKKKRLRRRGLRQGLICRRQYEGLPVPDAPTSEGENARVLPAPFFRVPPEQILNTRNRTKRLFEGKPLEPLFGEVVREALRQSIRDLENADELQELGMALFLDRPLGAGKALGEPDQTPLFSYEAFSRTRAREQAKILATFSDLLKPKDLEALEEKIARIEDRGISASQLIPSPHASVVSLQDARRSVSDFRILRSTPSTLRAFLDLLGLGETPAWDSGGMDYTKITLVLRGSLRADPDALVLFDGSWTRLGIVRMDHSQAYVSRAGWEFPAAGFIVSPDRESWDLPAVKSGQESVNEFRIRPSINQPMPNR